MFKTRLISGIMMIAVAYFVIYRGGVPLVLTLLMLSAAGMMELHKIDKKSINAVIIIELLSASAYYLILYINGFSILLQMPIIIGFLAICFVFVIKYPKMELKEITLGITGIIYLAVMLSYIYLLRSSKNGFIAVWLIFLGSWGADTCAYCVGMLIGKKRLAPVLSPKKSVEGAVGGVIGSVVLSLIYAVIFNRLGNLDSKYIYIYPIVAFMASIVSIYGDLFASGIKRKYNIKDYGKLIPGHGGVLDRFDSVIFTAPIVYYSLMLLNIFF